MFSIKTLQSQKGHPILAWCVVVGMVVLIVLSNQAQISQKPAEGPQIVKEQRSIPIFPLVQLAAAVVGAILLVQFFRNSQTWRFKVHL